MANRAGDQKVLADPNFGFSEEPNRIYPIQENLTGTEDPDDLMMAIMEALTVTEWSPDNVGAMYTFVYMAKTPKLLYDQHPLVEITEITRWGFRGFNYHWNNIRNYTFPEIIGEMYRVNPQELNSLRAIPYQKILYSP